MDLLQMELDKCLQSIACTGRQFANSIPTKYTLEWMFNLTLNPISASKWPLPQHIITWLCPSLVISAIKATVQFHFQKKGASAGFHQDIFFWLKSFSPVANVGFMMAKPRAAKSVPSSSAVRATIPHTTPRNLWENQLGRWNPPHLTSCLMSVASPFREPWDHASLFPLISHDPNRSYSFSPDTI